MFARVTSARIDKDKIEQFKKVYEKSVVPAAMKQKGFKGMCLMVDRDTGEGLNISYWNSEEDALASESNLYYQEQVALFLPFYTRDPFREGYDVLVQR
jgi:heme-degrading monooxygenase HmoA